MAIPAAKAQAIGAIKSLIEVVELALSNAVLRYKKNYFRYKKVFFIFFYFQSLMRLNWPRQRQPP